MAHMNGFEKHGLDEGAFGEKSSLSGLKTFDAFPKTKPTYTSATRRGGQWTLLILIFCALLTITEFRTWWSGIESHHFTVERGIGHELQLNLDIVVAMPCSTLHVNIQDAAMDRILAGGMLKKDETNWQMWTDKMNKKRRAYKQLHEENKKRTAAEEEDQRVGHVLGHMREGGRKFAKSPKLRIWEAPDSCRIYGSLEGNKVQGDFHITARGHGYMDIEDMQHHLDHATFNFSHYITELSFGPHYPSLLNPLDRTTSTTDSNFYKYQYYLSIVPTIFTKRRVSTPSGSLDPAAIPQPPTLDMSPDYVKNSEPNSEIAHVPNPALATSDPYSVFTNQYAVTSQSHDINSNSIPGIFFKYDIEPILLINSEQRSSFLALVVRLVNVVSGVLVGGGWMFQLYEWVGEVVGRGRRSSGGANMGVLHGRGPSVG